MTKLIAGALAALTLAGSAAVVTAPAAAEAQPYYGRHHGYGWRGHYRPRPYGYYGPRYRPYRYGYGPRYGYRRAYGPRYAYRHGYRHRW